ncbi:MAG: SGNH/GDSL hydrolase family protein [Gordonia sp. (in: high G+C Gram-positive bacteria)]
MTSLRRALTNRSRRRIAATTLGATAGALLPLSLAPAPAQAAPGDELIGVAGQILQQLPQAAGTGSSALPTDLTSLFNILIPNDKAPDGQNRNAPLTPTGDRKTRCTTVIHIGDSTSVGIDDPAKFSDPADRLSAQYARVGVTKTILDADGGRSIVEKVNDRPNAVDAIKTQLANGNRGCWVIAMGVNDAANIAVGSTVDADQRIDRVMTALNGQEVMWPTVATSNPTVKGYDNANMTKFDDALRRAVTRYPNLHVYDFAPEAQAGWYVDGIHYNATGLTQRNRLFATALATAFPASATNPLAAATR